MKKLLHYIILTIVIVFSIYVSNEIQSYSLNQEIKEAKKENLAFIDEEIRSHIINMDTTLSSLEASIQSINTLPTDSIGIKPLSLEYSSLELEMTAFEISRFNGSLENLDIELIASILNYYESVQYLSSIEEKAVQSFYLDLDQYQNLLIAQRAMVSLKVSIEEIKQEGNNLLFEVRQAAK